MAGLGCFELRDGQIVNCQITGMYFRQEAHFLSDCLFSTEQLYQTNRSYGPDTITSPEVFNPNPRSIVQTLPYSKSPPCLALAPAASAISRRLYFSFVLQSFNVQLHHDTQPEAFPPINHGRPLARPPARTLPLAAARDAAAPCPRLASLTTARSPARLICRLFSRHLCQCRCRLSASGRPACRLPSFSAQIRHPDRAL